MGDWGMITEIECTAAFEDSDCNAVEPNQLSGIISVVMEDYPPSTWMFAKLDGTPAGETYADGSALPSFAIPTYEFANGYHLLTVGGYTPDNGCWIQKVPVSFDNRLYFASIPDMYEPNEPYEITGFFDDGVIEISTEPNVSTISDTGYIKHTAVISAASAEATIDYDNGQSSETETFALWGSVDLSEKDPNSWRAVIIAPCLDVNLAMEDNILLNNRLITAIQDTLEAANIPYEKLIGKNAHWDNIKTVLSGPNLNYVYWIGHSNSSVGIGEDAVQRTFFQCWDQRRFLPDKESYVFSWLKSDSGYVPVQVPFLPDNWDLRGHSMASLKLWQTKNIKEFWAISCKSAEFSDMAMAVGAYAYKDAAGHYTHIYMGNRIAVMPGGARNLLEGYPSALSKIVRRHRTTNLENALLTNDLTGQELNVLWGPDRDRDGQADNTLQWWPSEIELDRVIFQ